MQKLAPAIQKETRRVMIITLVGVAVLIAVFGVCHAIWPAKVPFDYRVILGALCGGAVAVLNFFLMGITVQQVTSCEDDAMARKLMKASYTRRMLMMILWMVLAIMLPCFQFVAAILPLLIPSIGLKFVAISKKL